MAKIETNHQAHTRSLIHDRLKSNKQHGSSHPKSMVNKAIELWLKFQANFAKICLMEIFYETRLLMLDEKLLVGTLTPPPQATSTHPTSSLSSCCSWCLGSWLSLICIMVGIRRNSTSSWKEWLYSRSSIFSHFLFLVMFHYFSFPKSTSISFMPNTLFT